MINEVGRVEHSKSFRAAILSGSILLNTYRRRPTKPTASHQHYSYEGKLTLKFPKGGTHMTFVRWVSLDFRVTDSETGERKRSICASPDTSVYMTSYSRWVLNWMEIEHQAFKGRHRSAFSGCYLKAGHQSCDSGCITNRILVYLKDR